SDAVNFDGAVVGNEPLVVCHEVTIVAGGHRRSRYRCQHPNGEQGRKLHARVPVLRKGTGRLAAGRRRSIQKYLQRRKKIQCTACGRSATPGAGGEGPPATVCAEPVSRADQGPGERVEDPGSSP